MGWMVLIVRYVVSSPLLDGLDVLYDSHRGYIQCDSGDIVHPARLIMYSRIIMI